MSDHRASVKITASFHGAECDQDFWINYNGVDGECYGVDDRIIELFRGLYEEGMENYQRQQDEGLKEEKAGATEQQERAELARLKTKYKDDD